MRPSDLSRGQFRFALFSVQRKVCWDWMGSGIVRRMIALAAFAMVVSSPNAVHAKSVHKEFSKAWEARDVRCGDETKEALNLSQQAVDRFVTAYKPALAIAAMNEMP